MDFLKSTKGGPFGSAGGRIPEGGGASAPGFMFQMTNAKFNKMSKRDYGKESITRWSYILKSLSL